VSSAPFGGSGPGLLQRLRPTVVDPADLREVAGAVLPGLSGPSLRIAVVDRSTGGALVVLEEEEHRIAVRLAELAEDMTRAGIRNTEDALAAALTTWVAHRPVTASAAFRAGLAELDWTDPHRSGLTWRVVVRRGDVVRPWISAPQIRPGAVRRAREAAVGRSSAAGGQLRVEGPVALWSHPVPLLATAALADPEQMVARVGAAGLVLPDMHVVVTPSRPVACAAPGIAARLAGQITEDRLILPWRHLRDLPWS
jgi:hypothetical protein